MLLSIIVISLICLNLTCLGWSFILFWEVPIWNFHLLTFALHKIPLFETFRSSPLLCIKSLKTSQNYGWLSCSKRLLKIDRAWRLSGATLTRKFYHNSISFTVSTILSVKVNFHKLVCFMSCNVWLSDWRSALLMFRNVMFIYLWCSSVFWWIRSGVLVEHLVFQLFMFLNKLILDALDCLEVT